MRVAQGLSARNKVRLSDDGSLAPNSSGSRGSGQWHPVGNGIETTTPHLMDLCNAASAPVLGIHGHGKAAD